MKRRTTKMCKYAVMNVVEVSNKKQLDVIKKVLNTKSDTSVQIKEPKFNKNLWTVKSK